MVLLSSAISCKEDEKSSSLSIPTEKVVNVNGDLTISEIKDSQLASDLKKIYNGYVEEVAFTNSEELNLNGLDFESVLKTKIKDLDAVSYSVSYKKDGNNLDNDYAFIVYKSSQGYFNPTIVKTTRGEVQYVNLNSLVKVSYNINKISKPEIVDMGLKAGPSASSLRTDGCGQAVINCMTDAYSNHGWISVYAWVQSAYIPATAAALAAACAARVCLILVTPENSPMGPLNKEDFTLNYTPYN
ncbi:hypothetical protein Dfri01_51190 [Dyadobacter frigoris]|nr:hypothetical protein Dfri01_51190 [Dyadobacter frigoris]